MKKVLDPTLASIVEQLKIQEIQSRNLKREFEAIKNTHSKQQTELNETKNLLESYSRNRVEQSNEILRLNFALRKAERERDKAQEDATNYYAKVGELFEERDKNSKELEDIRAVFDHGADDELRFPGATLSESVKILIEKYLKYKEMFEMQTKIVIDLEMRLIKMEEQLKK